MSLEANSWRYENMKAKKGLSCLKNIEILKIKVSLTIFLFIIAQSQI